MNVENLVRMANDIGAFFCGAVEETAAVASIQRHLELYWAPRMREQIVEYARVDGSGLTGIVKLAVLKVGCGKGTGS